VPGGGVARSLGRELRLLQAAVGGHPLLGVLARQVEHGEVEGVEAGQSDELELVAHRSQLALELGDGGVVEILFPVERRRAVVGQELAGELAPDGLGELARLV
jgi:hypothetical protein